MKIIDQIYSHISNKYSRAVNEIPYWFFKSISTAIEAVVDMRTALKQNVFIKTASGSNVIGKKPIFTALTGIYPRLIGDHWNNIDKITVNYDSSLKKIWVSRDGFSYPIIYLENKDQDINLTASEPDLFWCFLKVSELPDTTAYPNGILRETVKLDSRYSVDYLGGLCSKRGISRRKNETDESLRNRALNLGLTITKWKIKKQLYFLTGHDIRIDEYRENWETACIPGISFNGYEGYKETSQRPGWMPERYFGAHYFEKSANIKRIKVYVPFYDYDRYLGEITETLNTYKMFGVRADIIRLEIQPT